MLDIPVIRWGNPYESLETAEVVSRDMRNAHKARQILRQFRCEELIQQLGQAADLFEKSTLPIGNGTQTPTEFVYHQSASTGLPEHLCRSNMAKNCFVLRNLGEILDCLTRGLPLDILTRGYGAESRGVTVSFQAQSPVLGAVLPSNSPGVHTLWLPVIALQMGLVLKPGSSEPWTAYRMASAFAQAGIPREVISLYPGGHDVGAAILNGCNRSMIFGSEKTVEQYSGSPKVQVHGPGFTKIFIGDDCVDRWEDYLDVLVESVFSNAGRSCINCSAIYASRNTRDIAQALAARLGPIEPLPPEHPESGLAAFTTPGMGPAVLKMIQQDLSAAGVTDCTAEYGNRLVEHPRCSYLRPVVAHADSPECEVAKKEFMFPFVTVVRCAQERMISAAGYTLVGTAITNDAKWIEALTEATNIDRLNIGPIPTNRLNWLQPHEGNLIDFLFRSRAYQILSKTPTNPRSDHAAV
jgi:hypothetical protein